MTKVKQYVKLKDHLQQASLYRAKWIYFVNFVNEEKKMESENMPTEIVAEIEAAIKNEIRELHLANREITILPPEISQLVDLHIFELNENKITELPAEIGYLN